MKACLTLVFEKEIDNDDMIIMKHAEMDNDWNLLFEIFDIGEDEVIEKSLEFKE